MDETTFIDRYFWVIAIVVTVANALAVKWRSRKEIRRDPTLAPGYRRLVLGVVVWGSLPWVAMGIAVLAGNVPTMRALVRPQDGNPFVIAWIAVLVVEYLIGAYWLFARQGAEFLVKHPGLLRGEPSSPALIRIVYCLLVVGGLAAVVVLWFQP